MENNTENIKAQMKQLIAVLQAAVDAIEGIYEAKVAVIVDAQIKEKDAQILELQGQLTEAQKAVEPAVNEVPLNE